LPDQTAFLKANYPADLFAAQMSLDAQDTDALAAYVQEMRDFGVRLLPPDVNRSGGNFLVETTAEGPGGALWPDRAERPGRKRGGQIGGGAGNQWILPQPGRLLPTAKRGGQPRSGC
jgi:hypothetical protein